MSTTDEGRPSTEPIRTTPLRSRGRGRRPADEVRTEVLDTTSRLLFTDGLAAITFERVAAESGASKTTLYRWWPSRGVLALEAYCRSVRSGPTFPDTGDIAADLATQLDAFVAFATRSPSGRVIAEPLTDRFAITLVEQLLIGLQPPAHA